MPLPELPTSLPENSSFFQQLGYGAIVAIAGLGWIWRQVSEGKKDNTEEQPPKPMILERAELADMEPVRQMVAQWSSMAKKLDDVVAAKADIEETRRATAEMKAILDRMARQADIDGEVARRMREEENRRDKDPARRPRA